MNFHPRQVCASKRGRGPGQRQKQPGWDAREVATWYRKLGCPFFPGVGKESANPSSWPFKYGNHGRKKLVSWMDEINGIHGPECMKEARRYLLTKEILDLLLLRDSPFIAEHNSVLLGELVMF